MESIRESLKEIEDARLGDLLKSEIKPESSNQSEVRNIKKGGFWIRFLAFAIDNVIIYFISLLLLAIGALAVGVTYSPGEGDYFERLGEIIPFPYSLTVIIMTMVYYTYFIGSIGQTIGKLICHIKVVQTNGEPLSYGQAFLRWVGYLASGIFLSFGFFWIAVDPNRQGWHDKIADTYVVRV
jgi:uncharacterized RDD family membrane protein YckC